MEGEPTRAEEVRIRRLIKKMSEEYKDIIEEEDTLELEEPAEGEPSGKFDKLLESDSHKFRLSGMF